MLRQARGFIRRSAASQGLMEPRLREIVSTDDDGRIRVMASDEKTADGVIPTLALVDELHRHRSADLYGVFRHGLGPRQGQMVTISTAGDDDESPLGMMRQAAYRLPVFKRDGAHTYARSPDGSYVMHEWASAACRCESPRCCGRSTSLRKEYGPRGELSLRSPPRSTCGTRAGRSGPRGT